MPAFYLKAYGPGARTGIAGLALHLGMHFERQYSFELREPGCGRPSNLFRVAHPKGQIYVEAAGRRRLRERMRGWQERR